MKKNKRFLTLIVSLICLLAVSMFAMGCSCKSCNDDETPNTQVGETIGTMPDVAKKFNFSIEETNVILGDEKFIPLLTEIAELEGLTFTSSNPEVATVVIKDNHALVKGETLGSTTIKGKLGTLETECVVTVTLGGLKPTIGYDNQELATYGVGLEKTFAIKPYVYFNGNKYYDFNCEYSGYDTQILSLEGGELKGIAKGETTVTATYTWRGVEILDDVKTYNVNVTDNVEFIIANGKFADIIQLYSVKNHAGIVFDKDVVIAPEIKVNGVARNDVAVEITAGTDVISYDAEEERLTAIKNGNAEIKITSASGDYAIEKVIPVIVSKPLAVCDKIIDFSTHFGTINVREVFGYNTKIVEAYQNGKQLPIEFGKIVGVKSSSYTSASREQIIVYDSEVGYVVNINAYLAKINTADEFVAFFANKIEDDFIQVGADNVNYKVASYYNTKGYVELGANIDLTGKTITNTKVIKGKTYANNSCSFTGVFEGNGYTVDNLTYAKNAYYGLFGYFDDATVRNVAFTNVTFDSETSTQSVFGQGCVSQASVYVNNVFVSVVNVGGAKSSDCGALFSGSSLIGVSLVNVLVEYPDIEDRALTYKNGDFDVPLNGGTLFGIVGATSFPYRMKDVYVVSKTKRIGMGQQLNWKETITNEDGTTSTVNHYVAPERAIHLWLPVTDKDDAKYADWGTEIVNTSNYLARKFIFDGVSPQQKWNKNNDNLTFGANGEVIRYDDYAQMANSKNEFSNFVDACWIVQGGMLKWNVSAGGGVAKDDVYIPEYDNDSWKPNWTPEA